MIATLLLLLAQPANAPSSNDAARSAAEAAAEAAEAEADAAGTLEAEIVDADDECADPQAQQLMNICAGRDYEAADVALNQQWDLTSAAMKAADTEVDREFDQQPGYYETLLEGQRAWLKYRDAQCLVESYEARGGSMQPMLNSFCLTYLTELRTQQLSNLAAGVPLDLPED